MIPEEEMALKAHDAVNLMSFINIMATSPTISRPQMLQALVNACSIILKNEYE